MEDFKAVLIYLNVIQSLKGDMPPDGVLPALLVLSNTCNVTRVLGRIPLWECTGIAVHLGGTQKCNIFSKTHF